MSNVKRDSSDSEEEEDELGGYGLSLVSITGPSKHDCGYCKGKDTSVSFGIWAHELTCQDYQSLIDRGWRRSGKYLYKPDLEKSCCPQYTIRLDTTRFSTSKSQKKILNKFNRYVKGAHQSTTTANNSKANNLVQVKSLRDIIHEPEDNSQNEKKLEIVLEPSSFTKQKYELYAKYQTSIHGDKEDDISEGGFKRFLVDSPMKIEDGFGSYHQKYVLDGKLIALAVIDILPGCISSVYFIYDPDYAFLGLGKYSVFREIALTQEYNEKYEKLKYYYMGFYIHSCPKMNYKGNYAPSDLLDPISYTWKPIEVFKSKLDTASFVTFSEIPNRDFPPGWVDPKTLKEEDYEKVFVLAGAERIVPVIYVVKFETSKTFKKSITDYICSVGLDLAQKMIIC